MLARILVVDDEPSLECLLCQKFRKKLRAEELQLFFARNGVEALSKLQDCPVDIVLTDINMPGMDGLTLIEKIKDIDPIIKTVVISAYDDIENIRKAMNCGAFDFLTKPINFQDLEITINKTWQHAQQLKEDLRLRQEKEEQLQQSESFARKQAAQLQLTLQNLQQTQATLIQAEKMSSLGQLVAGVAHEVNNPVNFIHGNLAHVGKYAQDLLELINLFQQRCSVHDPEIQNRIAEIDFDFLIQDLPKTLDSMQVGADRIRQIVLTLRNFSRLDEAEVKLVNIHEGLDSTLVILHHRLKAGRDHSGIQIIKEYGDLPLVECYAGQMNQVFMNILSNAIDALQGVGHGEGGMGLNNQSFPSSTPSIHIRTQVLNRNWLGISIKDNGPGMTESVKARLFDPFFTTKPVGKGTGLGLSISYQIVVDRHGGQLECIFQPGKGTEFWIEIPIRQMRHGRELGS